MWIRLQEKRNKILALENGLHEMEECSDIEKGTLDEVRTFCDELAEVKEKFHKRETPLNDMKAKIHTFYDELTEMKQERAVVIQLADESLNDAEQ